MAESPSGAAQLGPDLEAWGPVLDRMPWRETPAQWWEPGPRHGTWFPGGRLNAATALVTVTAERTPDAVAIYWEGEPGDRRSLTYGQLEDDVVALSRGLRSLGVGVGDVVALHLGWLPETVVAMIACARVGAAYAVIPTPLPPEAMADRLVTLGPKVLFTQDGAWRHGTVLPLKARADEALSGVDGIEHTVVVRRTGIDIGWFEGDRWYHDLVAAARPGRDRSDVKNSARHSDLPADVAAQHPLVLVSLAHRRGRPVTIALGGAAVVASALMVHRAGLAQGTVLWCAGDVSWLGTQVHGVYGPLAAGETAVIYEGTVTVPTPARAWQIMQRYAVTTLITTPSVLRTIRSLAVQLGEVPDVSELRRVVSFGEPMDPEVRRWAASGLRRDGVELADGWGQVELGGIVMIDAPVDGPAMPDLGAVVVDSAGQPVPQGDVGELVVTRPWAGAMVAARGPRAEGDATAWERVPGVYATDDLARVDAHGRVEFLGRTDEIVSVSGQLVSLMEIRAVLAEHPFVAAVDVIERRDHAGGRYLAAAVVLTPEADGAAGAELTAVARDLGQSVRETLGGLARPRLIMVVDRYGDELRGDERRRALAGIPVPDMHEPRRITWGQILAAAEHTASPPR
ncbi:MAG: AMP-binding protein [Dermatophilaceae bacterium]|nr:AMP-binding protein [Actinomycetales bacterium]MBP8880924.1 AMP-binding protein [Dermatophilaceae bacterium]MBP9917266.1 AMP-binding protein [Dermatophilaceae bacterium]